MAAAPSGSSSRMALPIDTRSPILTLSSATVPACGAGMSMVALSLSSVIKGSSTPIFCPASTWTSMIGISLKSPMSGTVISIAIASSPLQNQPAHVLEDVAQVASEAGGERAVDDAVVVGHVERLHQPRAE